MRRTSILILPLCLLLAAPAAAQSLFVELGESAPVVAAGWFKADDWSGTAYGAGGTIQGEFDFLVQYSDQDDGRYAVAESWALALRFHAVRPTPESPVGLAVEGGFTNGTVTWRAPGYEPMERDADATFLAGRLTLVPEGWHRRGHFYVTMGYEELDAGLGDTSNYPFQAGIAFLVGEHLVPDFSYKTADGEALYGVTVGWIF